MTTLAALEQLRPSAAVRRAVLATLDRLRAERRSEEAASDLVAAVQLELVAKAECDDMYVYGVLLTNAVEEEKEAGRL